MSLDHAVPQDLTLPEGVNLTDGAGGLPAVRVSTDAAAGEVYLHGAHVTHWQPVGQEPVLWVSPASQFERGAPIRGGVPLCYPWFAAGPSGEAQPMHGLVRLATWRLVDVTATGEGAEAAVTVALEITSDEVREQLGDDTMASSPGDFGARLEVTFGPRLTIALTATNPSDDDLVVEQALHTYLNIGHVGELRLEGLDGADYFDKVTKEERHQEGDVVLTESTDRVYDSGANLRLHDTALNRIIDIAPEHSSSTVVWNPWEDRPSLADIPAGAWTGFVCVETANVGRHKITLRPGAEHTVSVTYTLDAEE